MKATLRFNRITRPEGLSETERWSIVSSSKKLSTCDLQFYNLPYTENLQWNFQARGTEDENIEKCISFYEDIGEEIPYLFYFSRNKYHQLQLQNSKTNVISRFPTKLEISSKNILDRNDVF